MAINKAIIQIRRGPKADLQFDKLLPGELAIATDAPCMWFCWAVGEVEQIPTSDNIEEVTAEIIEKYLKDNPVTGISQIFMRVYDGYLQYSSDGKTYNNIIAVSELKGEKGDKGETGNTGSKGATGVGVSSVKQTTTSSEPGGKNVVTVTLTNGEKSYFNVLNGSQGPQGPQGPTGANGVGITQVTQTLGNPNGGQNTTTITLSDGNQHVIKTYNGAAGTQGPKGDKGDQGEPGTPGSDANVTSQNITNALGYTPADQTKVNELSQEIDDLNSSTVKVVKQSSVPSDTTVLWIDPSDNTGSGTIEQEANYQYIFKKNITDDYFWFWTESAGDKPYKYAYSGYSLVEPITLEAGTYCLSALMIAYSWIVTESGGLQRIDAFEPSSDKSTGYFILTLTETSTLYLAYHTQNQVSEVAPYLIKGNKPLNPGDYYEGVEGVSPEIFDYGVFIESYIKNCELVANELVGDNIGEAKGHYTGVKMDSNIRKIMCKAKLISNSSVALITTSLGSSKVTDITFGSVHLVFGVNRCSVGVFDTKDSLRLVQSLGYVITEGAEVSFGFDIDEQNNTLTVYLPDGTTQTVTDSAIGGLNGRYAIWEHFCNTSSGAFACSKMTKFYCKDADGEVLEDDFKRFDGAIGVAPTGQTYRQFTSHNGNNRDYK